MGGLTKAMQGVLIFFVGCTVAIVGDRALWGPRGDSSVLSSYTSSSIVVQHNTPSLRGEQPPPLEFFPREQQQQQQQRSRGEGDSEAGGTVATEIDNDGSSNSDKSDKSDLSVKYTHVG